MGNWYIIRPDGSEEKLKIIDRKPDRMERIGNFLVNFALTLEKLRLGNILYWISKL